MAIYLSFLVPKITAIVHAMPTNTQPTPSAWNHEHDRVLDFLSFGVAMAPNSNEKRSIYHPSRNGASRTTQCREIPHSQSHFTQCCKHRWVNPPPPPTPTSISPRNLCNKSLKDPVRGGGRLRPSADMKLS